MRILKFLPSAIVVCFSALPAFAQYSSTQKALDDAAAQASWVGGVAGIWRDGAVVWTGAAGEADRENGTPAEPDTVYRIASISKSMTATAVMQLVQYGRVDLDAEVQTYVPEIRRQEGPILIRHLLTHTSGIRHYKMASGENRPMDHYPTLTDAVALFADDKVPFEPGSRYRYTTYGYTLLGLVIERAGGLEYEDYMRDYVWKPAGMYATQLERRELPLNPKQAALYRRGPDGAPELDDMTDLSVKYPGGGITSTAGDLLRFAGAFMDNKLLEPETRALMFDPPELERDALPYGFGWILGEHPEYGRTVRHDGGQSGTTSNLVLYIDRGVAVVAMTNLYGEAGAVSDLTSTLADIAFAEE